MLARRSHSYQLWMITQQLFEDCDIAADDGVYRRFEVRDRRIGVRQRFQVFSKLRPASKPVAVRDEELCARQRAARRLLLRLLNLAPLPLDSFRVPADFSLNFGSDRPSLKAG
jgi:hypothetical protein